MAQTNVATRRPAYARVLRWPGHAARSELTRLIHLIGRRWQRRGIRGFALTAAATATVVILAVVDHQQHSNQDLLRACCGERASLPLWQAIVRLPGSLFAPSPLLPAWGSILQVLVVTALAEAAVGRVTAGLVAFAGHGLATASARLFLWLGPTVPLGLNATWRTALDTGPSAATLALGAYIAVIAGAPLLGAALTATTLAASLTISGLAGTEHVIALAVGLTCGAIHLAALRWHARAVTLKGVDVQISVAQR